MRRGSLFTMKCYPWLKVGMPLVNFVTTPMAVGCGCKKSKYPVLVLSLSSEGHVNGLG